MSHRCWLYPGLFLLPCVVACSAPQQPSANGAGGITAPAPIASGATLTAGFARVRGEAGDVRLGDRAETPLWAAGGGLQNGLINCVGSNPVSVEPVYTFSLATRLASVRIRTEGRESLLVGPGELMRCGAEHALDDAPAGEYQLFAITGAPAAIVIEDPAAERAALAETIAALPRVTLAPRVLNPVFTTARTGRAFDARDVGLDCLAAPHERVLVTPVARLDVADATTLRVPGPRLVAAGPGGTSCRGDVARGAQVLYAIAETIADPPATLALELDASAFPLAYPDAEQRHDLVASPPASPRLLEGRARAVAADRPSRLPAACPAAPLAPDLTVTVAARTELRPLWSEPAPTLRIVGPLDDSTPGVRCGAAPVELAPGRYAIWISAVEGTAYRLVTSDEATAIDPYQPLGTPPEAPALAARQLDRYYPFLSHEYRPRHASLPALGDDPELHLFLTAAEALFAYAARDTGPLQAGEPVLIVEAGPARTRVRLAAGGTVEVATADLTIERPASVTVRLQPLQVDDVSAAAASAGPGDAPAVARYQKVFDRYAACFDRYVEKHDESGDWDVLIVKSGRVVSMDQEIARAANRACGAGEVDAEAARLVKEINRSHAAQTARKLERLRARFGA
ncbi:MAG: hypothetical protein IPH44_29020 [Myxococcales bacterium]|nr:hypothetical protein [Myxococcales bacterium]